MVKKGKHKARLLIADDDPELLAMLSLRYGKLGYEVIEAADGSETLEKARAQRPDAVILDVMMPGKNGWEVARELRKDEATRAIPILVLTAIGPRMNEMTSPIYGADDYLDKPFEFSELDERIKTLLAKRNAAQHP